MLHLTTKKLTSIYIIWYREMLLFSRNQLKVFTSFFIPTALVVFLGSGFVTFFPTASSIENFSNFFFSGALVLSIVLNVFDSTISLVWDKEFGFMREILVAPVSKAEIVLGKILGATTRGLIQGILFLALAPILNIYFSFSQIALLLLLIFLTSIGVAGMGIIVASYIKKIESFSIINQIFISPLVFLSGAFFTLEKTPVWMQTISYFNPLFYSVNGIRLLVFNTNFIPQKMSNMLFYNFNFAVIFLIFFASISLLVSTMIFSKVKITEVIRIILKETEDMI